MRAVNPRHLSRRSNNSCVTFIIWPQVALNAKQMTFILGKTRVKNEKPARTDQIIEETGGENFRIPSVLEQHRIIFFFLLHNVIKLLTK